MARSPRISTGSPRTAVRRTASLTTMGNGFSPTAQTPPRPSRGHAAAGASHRNDEDQLMKLPTRKQLLQLTTSGVTGAALIAVLTAPLMRTHSEPAAELHKIISALDVEQRGAKLAEDEDLIFWDYVCVKPNDGVQDGLFRMFTHCEHPAQQSRAGEEQSWRNTWRSISRTSQPGRRRGRRKPGRRQSRKRQD